MCIFPLSRAVQRGAVKRRATTRPWISTRTGHVQRKKLFSAFFSADDRTQGMCNMKYGESIGNN